ncbi:hypothetical protein BC826DRAFT_644205 [Russula brevipes]|nr:hypothetical protein BC826DRAFT_644205 [Russula brevipes]
MDRKRRRAAKAGRSGARTTCVCGARKSTPFLSNIHSCDSRLWQRAEAPLYAAHHFPCPTRRIDDVEIAPDSRRARGVIISLDAQVLGVPRSSSMRAWWRVGTTVGRTCSSVRSCAGHWQSSRSAATILADRFQRPEVVYILVLIFNVCPSLSLSLSLSLCLLAGYLNDILLLFPGVRYLIFSDCIS